MYIGLYCNQVIRFKGLVEVVSACSCQQKLMTGWKRLLNVMTVAKVFRSPHTSLPAVGVTLVPGVTLDTDILHI